MAENPLGHEINAATDEEMLSFLAGFYPATNPNKLSDILKYGVGAMNIEACKINGASPTNLLECWFEKGEKRIHEAQNPVKIMEFLIKLTTREDQSS